MENVLHLGLSNAVASVGLALVAAAAAFLIRRRPALIHALWLLVLLKLFTPALVRLPAPWPVEGPSNSAEGAAGSERAEANDVEDKADPIILLRLPEEEMQAGEEDVRPEFIGPMPQLAHAEPAAADAQPPERATPSAPAAVMPSWPRPNWIVIIAAVWVAGSLGWFLLAAGRVLRFRRLLRFAKAAPRELRERTQQLARELGVARCPEVWLIPGRLSPMLFAAGGAPRLLVPADLLGQVHDDQLDTLLLHELAHLRRRDHWVRGLEFLAMGLYWWNPVVWWARRELREAEEQCCDAWVVSVLSGSRRAYAEALVETLDFLSQAPSAPPLLASGIGHVTDLKRRLTMILSGTTQRALTWRGALTMLGLTALLPLLPAWVRAEEPGAEKKLIEAKQALEFQLEFLQKAAANPEAEKVQAELKALQAQLAQKLAEVKALEEKLKSVQDRVKKTGPGIVVAPGNLKWEIVPGDEQKRKIIALRFQDEIKPGAAPKGTLYELVPGEKGTLILRPVAAPPTSPLEARIRAVEALNKIAPVPPVPPVLPPNARTKELEKRLDEIMKELEQLRKEMKGGRAAPAQSGTPPARPEEQSKIESEQKGIILRLDKGGEIRLTVDKDQSYPALLEHLKRAQEELERASKKKDPTVNPKQ